MLFGDPEVDWVALEASMANLLIVGNGMRTLVTEGI